MTMVKNLGATKIATSKTVGYDFFDAYTFGPIDIIRTNELSKADLEQNILDSTPPSLRKRLKKYIKTTMEFASKYQVDPFWALAIMWTESHFISSARSYVRATGLMQIMPQTGHFLSHAMNRPVSPRVARRLIKDPIVNIEMGIFYLKQLFESFGRNYRLATVAYNMGPARVRWRLRRRLDVGVRNRYLDKVRRAYSKLTRNYVEKVMSTPAPYRYSYVARNRVVGRDIFSLLAQILPSETNLHDLKLIARI